MKRVRQSMLLGTASALLGFAMLAAPARACPNCKEAVSLNTEDVANVSRGYNWSVLFMISMPFMLFGSGAYAVRRAVKNGSFPEL